MPEFNVFAAYVVLGAACSRVTLIATATFGFDRLFYGNLSSPDSQSTRHVPTTLHTHGKQTGPPGSGDKPHFDRQQPGDSFSMKPYIQEAETDSAAANHRDVSEALKQTGTVDYNQSFRLASKRTRSSAALKLLAQATSTDPVSPSETYAPGSTKLARAVVDATKTRASSTGSKERAAVAPEIRSAITKREWTDQRDLPRTFPLRRPDTPTSAKLTTTSSLRPDARRRVFQLPSTPAASQISIPAISKSPWIPNSTNSTNPDPKTEIHLHFDEEEAINCFNHSVYDTQEKKTIQFYRELNASKGSIVGNATIDVDQLKQILHDSRAGCTYYGLPLPGHFCCTLRVRTGSSIAIEVTENDRFSSVLLSDTHQFSHVSGQLNATENSVDSSVVFVTSRTYVDITWNIKDGVGPTLRRLALRFNKTGRSYLQVKYAGLNTGFVETPLFRSPSLILNRVHSTFTSLTAPVGHVIMISYPKKLIMNQIVTYHDREGTVLEFIILTIDNTPSATVYNTNFLLIKIGTSIITYSTYRGVPGFQLLFSFLKGSQVQWRLPSDAWNCSVPYRSLLLHHLSCNLHVECYGAEDEGNCSYTTAVCGPYYLTLGGVCFFYLKRKEPTISWNQASDICESRGGRLAVLDSVDKWKDAVEVLPYAKFGVLHIHLGIRTLTSNVPLCATKDITLNLHDGGCNVKLAANMLCERVEERKNEIHPKAIVLNDTVDDVSSEIIRCPLGHYIHKFQACSPDSSCFYGHDSGWCESAASVLRLFTCKNQMERVHYPFVCDFRDDCSDGSDEDFCNVAPCETGYFKCFNKQCISTSKVCDGWEHCSDGEDETCAYVRKVEKTLPPPAIITVSVDGRLVISPLSGEGCPYTHFQCPNNGYCLPVFLRCNGMDDCPGREDEKGCDTCPAFYRCRGSTICLLLSNLCDGRAQCPKHDDELCLEPCPVHCTCCGEVFFCEELFSAHNHLKLRFLDATGSGLNPKLLKMNRFLIHLSVADCSLKNLDNLNLANLLSLNVENNLLVTMNHDQLVGVPQLRELYLAGNPIDVVFTGDVRLRFPHLMKLDLSHVAMHVLNGTQLSVFVNLQVLNLSHTGLELVTGKGFRGLKQLRVIDLRGCPMTWLSRGIFHGLSHLQTVHAQSFRLCCPAALPRQFNSRGCFAPSNEISSCDDLLRGTIYKIGVIVLSLFALVGNTVSFIFRICISKREKKLGHGNFVTHLSVSDLLMGIYLAVIGTADQVYHGTYLWNDGVWRHTKTCTLAGVVSLMSSEVSALIMCLITLDRFLVLCFPFSRLHFSSTSAHTISGVVWIGVLFLAVMPLTSHWDFYSQTGICIPLPTIRYYFVGHEYSFGILIVFNFIVFVFISTGQLIIYWAIHTNSMSASNTTKTNKDMSIARRLITVAMTDFLCWFPIGVCGLLASSGVPIQGEINQALAIFVLPLNSAVNPCLYTLNVIIERRRRGRENKLRAALLAQLKTGSR